MSKTPSSKKRKPAQMASSLGPTSPDDKASPDSVQRVDRSEASYRFNKGCLTLQLAELDECFGEFMSCLPAATVLEVDASGCEAGLGFIFQKVNDSPKLTSLHLKGFSDAICEGLPDVPSGLSIRILTVSDAHLSEANMRRLFAFFPSVSLLFIEGERTEADVLLQLLPSLRLAGSLQNLALSKLTLTNPVSLQSALSIKQLRTLKLSDKLGYSDTQLAAAMSAPSTIDTLTLGFVDFECILPSFQCHKDLSCLRILPAYADCSGVGCWKLVIDYGLDFVEIIGTNTVYELSSIALSGYSTASMLAEQDDGQSDLAVLAAASAASTAHSGGVSDELSIAAIMGLFAQQAKDPTEAPKRGVDVAEWLNNIARDSKLPKTMQALHGLLGRAYKVWPVAKDGNCFFSAINLYLPHDDDEQILDPRSYRDLLCYELLRHPERYAMYVPNDDDTKPPKDIVEGYVARMSASGEWAGEVDAHVMSNVLKRPISIVAASAAEADCRVTLYRPSADALAGQAEGHFLLLHYNGTHYQPILPRNFDVDHATIQRLFMAQFSDVSATSATSATSAAAAAAVLSGGGGGSGGSGGGGAPKAAMVVHAVPARGSAVATAFTAAEAARHAAARHAAALAGFGLGGDDSDLEEDDTAPSSLLVSDSVGVPVSLLISSGFKFNPSVLALLAIIAKQPPAKSPSASKAPSAKPPLFAYTDRSQVSEGASIAVGGWLKRVNGNRELAGELLRLSTALAGCRATAELGDGNCFFHALRRQLGVSHTATDLRQLLVKEIGKNVTEYEAFLPKTAAEYIPLIAEDGQWAGEVDIKAMANALGRPICLVVCVSAQQGVAAQTQWRTASQVIVHRPTRGAYRKQDCLFVHYNGRNHYQSIVPGEGVSAETVLDQLEALNQPVPQVSASAAGLGPSA